MLALDGVMDPHRDDSLPVQALFAAGFVALVVGASALSYRYVERPGLALGRLVGDWLDRRLGPDTTRARLARVHPTPAEPAPISS